MFKMIMYFSPVRATAFAHALTGLCIVCYSLFHRALPYAIAFALAGHFALHKLDVV